MFNELIGGECPDPVPFTGTRTLWDNRIEPDQANTGDDLSSSSFNLPSDSSFLDPQQQNSLYFPQANENTLQEEDNGLFSNEAEPNLFLDADEPISSSSSSSSSWELDSGIDIPDFEAAETIASPTDFSFFSPGVSSSSSNDNEPILSFETVNTDLSTNTNPEEEQNWELGAPLSIFDTVASSGDQFSTWDTDAAGIISDEEGSISFFDGTLVGG